VVPDTPHIFAQLLGEARREIEDWEQSNHATREEQIQLAGKKKEAENSFSEAVKEVEALRRQPSNIQGYMLELRQNIATAIGVAEGALPFVGELIEVKASETEWQGAIERVLHGFALSILVSETHYPALYQHINGKDIGQRLVYHRTGSSEHTQPRPLLIDSMVNKLNVKESVQAEWLRAELRHGFNYACVDSGQAFRKADRALTREGQIKHSKTKHEKDDRRKIDDRRNWVLGFNNQEKLALFQRHAQELADTISDLDRQFKGLAAEESKSADRRMQCQTLANLQWQEIDVQPLIDRIAALDRHIRDAREGNSALRQIGESIIRQKVLVHEAENCLSNTRVQYQTILNQIRDDENKLSKLEQNVSSPLMVPLTAVQQQGLDERFAKLPDAVRLDNLDPLTMVIVQMLNKETTEVTREINACEKAIEKCFTEFIAKWKAEATDVQANLASAPDFFAKLIRLETDGLTAHEQRFFDLLQNQSHQNLAALSTHLSNARKEIHERMELVNDSLKHVPFNQTQNQTSYLRIDTSDRQLAEVREFKQEIQQALSHAWSDERELAESRFVVLRRLVERLSSQDPEQKRWRESVLDVRLHVEFIGVESDEEGVVVEIHRSGAGKSGGQRQKLATTCLAAALRYQLGGNERSVPKYAAVIMDEAFDKADNDFTLAMNIFTNFGFQMIVATRLKSVMTIEPFIGGACFVDISDRRVSAVLLIEYDCERQRLKLTDHAREQVSVEAIVEVP
jgi:uncharacterized protein YPO0396